MKRFFVWLRLGCYQFIMFLCYFLEYCLIDKLFYNYQDREGYIFFQEIMENLCFGFSSLLAIIFLR